MLNQYIKNSLYAAALLGFATACEPEIERDEPIYEEARGEADFSTYVALGNSLTAGYADNALYREAQLNSYPAIIAEKIQYINPSLEFNQPLMPEGNGVGFVGGQTIGRLQLQSVNPLSLSPTLPSTGWENPVSGPVHNLGVPGARVGHLLAPGYGNPANGAGNYNPYYARFASSTQSSVLEQAIGLNPTFFTLWIGNNDVLSYALDGGAGNSLITPAEQFQVYYTTLVGSLVAAQPGIEGAVANIADITKIPFFNTIRYNQLVLTAEQAEQANAAYAAQIDPNVRAGVDSVAKTQVIRAVIEAGTRAKIEAQVRPAVAQGVATQAVYQAAYEEAKAGGATDEQAAAIAQAYVESPDGQTDIENLKNALLNEQAPAELQAIYEQTAQEQIEAIYNSDDVQAQMDATYEAAINNMDDLVSVLGEEGAAAVEANFNSEQVVAMREAAFNDQISKLKAAGFYPVFEEGPNEFVIQDTDNNPANPLGIREIREGELLLLNGQVAGLYTPTTAAQPKPNAFVLTQTEINKITEATASYNATISNVASTHTLALVDMNSFFNNVADGYMLDGTNFSAAFITGNAFSLDGVHLTQKGYALVARRFIEEINSYYNSNLPLPNLRNYPAVGLP